jgi:DNA-binding response OmpR family regulator
MIAHLHRFEDPFRILIVDDEPVVRHFMVHLIRAMGHMPIEAGGFSEAAVAIREKGPFSLLVTDLSMPGKDGWALSGHFRGRFPGAGVLVVSADCEGLENDSGRLQEGVRVLVKPFSPSDLKGAIEALLPGSIGSQEPSAFE